MRAAPVLQQCSLYPHDVTTQGLAVDMRRIAVVVLNHNGWKDTIACVESVLAGSAPPAWVVIVDNASVDDSADWFTHWAEGRLDFLLPGLGVSCGIPKPFELQHMTPGHPAPCPKAGGVILLHSPVNNGYAAGNNMGVSLAMEWGADAVWILHNDTLVGRAALGAMRDRLFSSERPGLCGSLVCYHGTNIVQCMGGGRTNPWTGLSVLYGHMRPVRDAAKIPSEAVEADINFIYGASVMASRDFILTVGLMDERFFLYCEEQDWAYSAQGRFDLVYAPGALVHHKEGATTGFSRSKMKLLSLCLLTRSRLLLTLKHKPPALPTVFASVVFAGLRLLWRRGNFTALNACQKYIDKHFPVT